MKHLTVRDLPEDVAEALERERKARGWSLNRTVKELLRRSLGVGVSEPVDNGLGKLAGGWTEEEHAEFERATACFETVDEEVWK